MLDELIQSNKPHFSREFFISMEPLRKKLLSDLIVYIIRDSMNSLFKWWWVELYFYDERRDEF